MTKNAKPFSERKKDPSRSLCIEDKTIRAVLVALHKGANRLGENYAETSVLDWLSTYLESKYGRILKCRDCGAELRFKDHGYHELCPRCQKKREKEKYLAANMTPEQKRKKRECEKRCIERMKESGRRWKELRDGCPGMIKVQKVDIAGVRHCTRELVIRTGMVHNARKVRFLDYMDTFVSALTGRPMTIRLMSLRGTGDDNVRVVRESNLIGEVKAVGCTNPAGDVINVAAADAVDVPAEAVEVSKELGNEEGQDK